MTGKINIYNIRGFVLIFILMLSWSAISAQNFKAANKYFAVEAYSIAKEYYDNELKKSTKANDKAYAQYKIGECLFRMNHPEQAIDYFEAALLSGYHEAPIYFSYACALQMTANYSEAKALFEQYQEKRPNDKRTANKIVSCEWALSNTDTNPLYFPIPLEAVNTSGSEYGVAYYENGLIYSSTGPVGGPAKTISPRTGLQHSNIYFSSQQNGIYEAGVPLDGLTRSKKLANSGTFSYDYTNGKLYYTRCEEGDKNCYTHEVKIKGGKYQLAGKLKIGNRQYDIGHTYVADRQIYFTSTMPGGFGGIDIWYIEQGENGKWGKPVNMGENVNTAANEGFPFIFNNKLFFASDGQIGYGGLDLFVAELTDSKAGKVQNLGRPFNSSHDDFNLIITGNRLDGMLVSSRNNAERSDDIFTFKGFPSNIKVKGFVANADTKKKLPNRKIEVINNGQTEQTIITDSTGHYQLYLFPCNDYELQVETDDTMEETTGRKVNTQGLVVVQSYDADLFVSPKNILAKGKLYDQKTSKPIANAEVVITSRGMQIAVLQTDVNGFYETKLPFAEGDYTLTAQAKGYMPDIKRLSGRNDTSGKTPTYSVDFALIKLEIGTEFFLNNLLYGYNKATLTPTATNTLNHLLKVLQDYPGMKIAISSYTDIRGGEGYNLVLSEKRSQAVVNYLVSKGIKTSRINAKSYGKAHLLIPNAQNEAEHQENRRSSFRIITMGNEKK